MSELEELMKQVFVLTGAYSEDGNRGWVGMLRANLLRKSLNALQEHRGEHHMDETEIERWIRADVGRIKGLSPSQSEELIRLGVRMSMLDEEGVHD